MHETANLTQDLLDRATEEKLSRRALLAVGAGLVSAAAIT
jgi:hypothetical protein